MLSTYLILVLIVINDVSGLKCKNPKGKVGETKQVGCHTSVCKKKNKWKAFWETCTAPSTEANLNSFERKVMKKLENIENQIQKISCDKPTTNLAQESSTTPAKGKLEKKTVFTENGETFIQEDTHHHETGETHLKVPAHGKNIAINVIMHGDSRKMIVSTRNQCLLQDIPHFVNTEHIKLDQKENSKRSQDKEETYHMIHSKRRLATENEKKNLTASMLKECEGKDIIVTSVETFHQDDYVARDDFSNNGTSLKRALLTKNQQRAWCRPGYLKIGCMDSVGSNCWRWRYRDVRFCNASEESCQKNFSTYHFEFKFKTCVECCDIEDTPYFPCECITDAIDEKKEQALSTASAITLKHQGLDNFECLRGSKFCHWDGEAEIDDCNFKKGACVEDSECDPHYLTPTTSTTPTTHTT